jgi:hypothetical protein
MADSLEDAFRSFYTSAVASGDRFQNAVLIFLGYQIFVRINYTSFS